MYLPDVIVDNIFSYIDVKCILYQLGEIHCQESEIYNIEYFTSGNISRATYKLFLKKQNLLTCNKDCIIIYYKFCQTCIKYWILNNINNLNECLTSGDKEILINKPLHSYLYHMV